MSEMVDRAAEAMMKVDFDDKISDYYKMARAAIEAMRELPGDPGPRYTAGEYSRRTQEAMVDDALALSNGDRE
jgi:hypothetical protein